MDMTELEVKEIVRNTLKEELEFIKEDIKELKRDTRKTNMYNIARDARIDKICDALELTNKQSKEFLAYMELQQQKPLKFIETLKKTFIGAIVTSLAGICLTGIFMLIKMLIK